MKIKSVIIGAIILAVLAVIFFVVPAATGNASKGGISQGSGGGMPGMGGPGGGGGFSSNSANVVYSVKSAVAEEASLQQYLELNGEVTADTNVAVYPDAAGKLVRQYVKVGSTVSKGDLLAEVDPSKPGSVYSTNKVYSPISGTITSLDSQVGETVSTSTSLLYVGQVDELSVTVQVPEKSIGLLRLGLAAKITFEAFPGDVFEAQVKTLSPVVDPDSRTKEVTLKFTKKYPRVNAGMFAKVMLYADPRPTHVIIQEDAVLSRFDSNYVFVLDTEDTVKKVEVTTGVSVNGNIEVLSGLKANDRYVVKGMELLDEGSKVKDISQSTSDSSSQTNSSSPEQDNSSDKKAYPGSFQAQGGKE